MSDEMEAIMVFDSLVFECHGKEVTEEKAARIKTEMANCLLAIGGCSPLKSGRDEQECLQAIQQGNFSHKHIMAASLLRLLVEPSFGWLGQNPWRPALTVLFDSELSDSVYKDNEISPGMMGHEKIERLTKFVSKQEDRLREALEYLTSLDRAEDQRRKLMQVLNSRDGRAIFRPFLLSDIDGRLSDLYEHVVAYVSGRGEANAVELADDAVEVTKQLGAEFDLAKTSYCRMLKTTLCDKMMGLIKQDISANEAAKPGQLSINAGSRKYPLDNIGSIIQLELWVDNNGHGYAYDVQLTAVGQGIDVINSEIQLGKLLPGVRQSVRIEARLSSLAETPTVYVEGRWNNYDKTPQSTDCSFLLSAHDIHLPGI